jgi:DMSO/TMAO reductase YedYZ molybdopterin-dependent catalytic subunit
VSEGTQTLEAGVRLAELMAPLALAADLDVGQPLEHALGACLLAGATLFAMQRGLLDSVLAEK